MTDLASIIDEVTGGNQDIMHRERPYSGQSHTDDGERGRQEVHGVTMRDVRDCFMRAVALSSGPGDIYREADKGPEGHLTQNDLYDLDLSELDVMAISQNLTCEIERIMGIFPNIPSEEKS